MSLVVEKSAGRAGRPKAWWTLLAWLPVAAAAQPSAELFLFQPLSPSVVRLIRTTPGCQKEAYPFATEVHCFSPAPKVLQDIFLKPQLKLGAPIRLLPPEFRRPDLGVGDWTVDKFDLGLPRGAFHVSGNVYAGHHPSSVGTATLTVVGKRVAGRITDNGDVYEIRPLKNGLHVVIKADRANRLPLHPVRKTPDVPPGRPGAPPSGPSPPASAASSPTTGRAPGAGADTNACSGAALVASNPVPTISIGVVFEEGAMSADTDFQVVGGGYVSAGNAAMTRSQVGARLALAGSPAIRTVKQVALTDDALDEVIDGDASTADPIGDLHRWRAVVKADIVLIIASSMPACGVSKPRPSDPKLGFIMVHPSCAVNYLQIFHEIGHVLGADHQQGGQPFSVTAPYARAFESVGNQARTIMFSADDGTMKENYSNPRVSWSIGTQLVTTGEPCKSDNARAMTEWAPTIEKFFP